MSSGHVVDMWSDGDNTFRPHRPEWQEMALCRGETELFFNEGFPHAIADAKKFCAKCNVRRICLKFALDNDEIGVWGGTTTMERLRLRKTRRRNGDFTSET
jgi:WhiB family transcriptional regulator, redox-sensing transcriptional regulator